MRTTYNIPFSHTSHVQRLTGHKYDEALRLLNLFAWMEYRADDSSVGLIRQGEIVRGTGLSRNTVRKSMETMRDLGWIEFESHAGGMGGTRIKINGIEFPKQAAWIAFDRSSADSSAAQERSSADTPERSSGDSSTVTPCPLDGQAVTDKQEETKNSQENQQETPPPSPSGLRAREREIIEIWNSHKPKGWESIRVMGPRMKTAEHLAKQLGGASKLLEYLPLALAEFAKDPWWSSRRMTWANVMGTGNTDKTHFVEKLDRALACQGSDPDAASTLEHPDFFAPDPAGELFPKHNSFSDDADRATREQDARAFYAALSL